jgi:hypothetical protein
MLLAVKIMIVGTLWMIFIQDIKSRAVYWFLFPLLCLAFILIYYIEQRSFTDYWRLIAFNLFFLILQMVLVSAWFSVRRKKWIIITEQLLGWGDILFIVCLTFCFSPGNFIVFYIGSLILVLAIWLVGRKLLFSNSPHIPLAGLQALMLMLLFIFNWFKPFTNLTSDVWLIQAFS